MDFVNANVQCNATQEIPDTLYRKIAGTIVFVAVWPFIVLDMKWFPLGRPAAALTGGMMMVVFVIVPQGHVFETLGEQGNLQTLFLLIGMMMLSYYYDREGLLQVIALWIFGKSKPFKLILWKVCVLSAVLSAIITNDATCLVVTPLLLEEHMKQKRSRKEIPPLLLGIATSANIGSAMTFFGNPQNAFIAARSQGEISLLVFFVSSLPAALLGMFFSVGLLYLFYIRTIILKSDQPEMDLERPPNPEPPAITLTASTIARSRDEIARSHDQSGMNGISKIALERDKMYSSIEPNVDAKVDPEYGSTFTSSGSTPLVHTPAVAAEVIINRVRTVREKVFAAWLVIITVVLVLLLAIPPPPTLPVQFNLGLVPMGAAISTMLADTIINKTYAYDAMLKIDWCLILMFMGLFVWLAGFQSTRFPEKAFENIFPFMDLLTVQGVLVFALFTVAGSNILSNVPLVILIVDRLFSFQCGDSNCSAQLSGLLLAWVSTVAGNFTLIGSVANLIVAEKARSTADYRLSFWQYLKFGFCSTLMVLFSGLPLVYYTARGIHI